MLAGGHSLKWGAAPAGAEPDIARNTSVRSTLVQRQRSLDRERTTQDLWEPVELVVSRRLHTSVRA